jgi:predicted RecA/RadA family phage recombinase
VLLTLSKGLFDDISLENMGQAEKAIRKGAYQLPKAIQEHILSGKKMSQEDQDKIIAMAVDILSQFKNPK